MMKQILLAAAVAAVVAGCSGRPRANAPEAEPVTTPPVEASVLPAVVRLDNPDSLHPGSAAARLLVEAAGLGDSVTPAAVAALRQRPWLKAFGPQVAQAFAGWQGTDTLARAAARLAALMPEAMVGEIGLVVLPYRQSVVVDSASHVALIALNHYLGAAHEAYTGFPAYERAMKEAPRMTPDLVEALVNVARPLDAPASQMTVAAALLREGAVVELVMQACGIGEREALGYDAEAYAWATANEGRAWRTLVEGQMLFSADPDVAARLLSPSPATALVAPEAPGRLGRFIGHRLARAWLEAHPGLTAADLLLAANYAAPSPLVGLDYAPR